MKSVNIQLKQSSADLMGALPELDISGLRPAQLELFKLLSACIKYNQPFKLDLAASIYFNIVKDPNKPHIKSHTEHSTDWETKNKDIWEHFSQPHLMYKRRYLENDVINWLKLNIGSLVMRGFLSAIPTFDYELVKNIKL